MKLISTCTLFFFLPFVWGQRFEVVQTLGDTDSFFPRSDMGYAVDEAEKAWFFGGVTENMAVSNDLFTFEVNSAGAGTYTKIETVAGGNVPSPRSSVGLAATSEYVFIVGGVDSNGNHNTDTAWLFERATNTWTDVSGGGPGPRSATGVAVYDGTFVVIGGRNDDSSALDEVWQFVISNQLWLKVPIAPGGLVLTPRASPYVHAAADTLYAIGGFDKDGLPISSIQTTKQTATDLDQHWIESLPSPTPEQAEGAFNPVFDGAAFFLFGGTLAGGSAGCGVLEPLNPTDQTWFFDLGSESWIEQIFRGSKPPKLVKNAGVFIEPYFYSMGGFEFECENNVGGPKPSMVTYRYQVVTPTLLPTMPPTAEPDDDILGDATSGTVPVSFLKAWSGIGAGLAFFL